MKFTILKNSLNSKLHNLNFNPVNSLKSDFQKIRPWNSEPAFDIHKKSFDKMVRIIEKSLYPEMLKTKRWNRKAMMIL